MSKHTPKQADGTCKTCKHFILDDYGDFGYCRITLPPWVKVSYDDNSLAHKDASCDLYVAKATGEQQ